MSVIDENIRKAGKADARLRAALIAECAERAYPVYENAWDGTFADCFKRAIEIGWDFALGRPVDAKEVQACLAEIDTHVDSYLDDGNDLPGTYCVLAKRVLECLSAKEDKEHNEDKEADAYKAFGRGISTYIDVATFAEADADMAHSDQPPEDEAESKAKEWADKALALISAWQGAPSRGMFDALGPKPPEWLGDWLARKR